METKNETALFEKKTNTIWNGQTKEQDIKDNLVLENELTVEITLNEYRNLIRTSASGDVRVKELEEQKLKLYTENNELKKQLEALKAVLRKPEDDKESEEVEDY